jgi:hypothetical protein
LRTLHITAVIVLLASGCVQTWEPRDSAGDETVEAADQADNADPGPDAADIPSECPPPLVSCDGQCVDTSSNHSHCGACGNECDAVEVCNEGACLLECPSDKASCDGACVDVMTDILNCGACGTVCHAGLRAVPVCRMGICDVLCEEGWSDMDGDGSCETNCVPTSTTETCNGLDDDCDGAVDEDFDCTAGEEVACTTVCGSTGVGLCTMSCSLPPADRCTPATEVCNGRDDDCDGQCDEDFDCCRGESGACTTTCGSTGSGLCSSVCTYLLCTPPAETCNGADDDCDGSPDESTDCRVPVYRFYCPSIHKHVFQLESTMPPYGECNEGNVGWYSFSSAQSGPDLTTVEFFKLHNPVNDSRVVTPHTSERDSLLASGFELEGNVGYCSITEPIGFGRPLYHLYKASQDNHFYCLGEAERDNAVANLDYVYEGIICYVWGNP